MTEKVLKLHPLLLRAVVESLHLIFQEGQYADRVIERALKSNPKWGARDRGFIAETVYETVRWYRLLYEVQGSEPKNHGEWWKIVGTLLLLRGRSLPDWDEFRGINPERIGERYDELRRQRAIAESIPQWLDELGERELGERWPETLSALNEPAQVSLRVNRLKARIQEVQESLRNDGIETRRMAVDTLVTEGRHGLFRTAAFQNGLFEVQDYSSQLVAPLLGVEPGMRVVDACAGGGGKTLHLAAMMENKGQLIALDTEAWKLDELRRRARRAGATNIEARNIDSSKVIKRLYDSADRLLLDVPCSGLGVLRRNPDAKWKLNPEFIGQLRRTQQEILSTYSRIVRPGGRLVYATCSILPSENEEQVQKFLADQSGKFRLLEEKRIMPQDQGFDGFYMALIERQEKNPD